MNKRILLSATLALPLLLHAQVLNKPKVAVRNWATGFTQPVAVANCGDSRMFIVQKAGVIKIVSDSMTVEPTPFLDITSRVNSTNNEQGLLGLVFEPNYLDSGYFYVYYTHGDPYFDRLSRFRVTADPNVADPNSEQVLIDVPDPEWNHNGGDLHFGSDGYLYVSFGDGGSGNDPWNNGQNYTEPLGGMFRIDVSEHNDHYLIPPTNHFAYEDGTDTLPELWAVGLRNPWRYSFDRLTGDLWIGDVGQNTWEEVDKWPAEDTTCPNFGWRCREGFVATPGISQSGCQDAGYYVSPLAAFNHTTQGWCSVIGGYVYRGAWYPHHYGHYIFTDYCAGDFLTFSDETNTDVDTMLMTTTAGYAAFGEDAGDQAGGGGLAMGTGDGDTLLEAHQLGQHLGPGNHRHMALAGRDDLRIVGLDGGRHDDGVGLGDVFSGMADMHLDALGFEAAGGGAGRQVGTRNLVAQVGQHLGDAAHPRAADADEVDVLDLVFHTGPFTAEMQRRRGDATPNPVFLCAPAPARCNFQFISPPRHRYWPLPRWRRAWPGSWPFPPFPAAGCGCSCASGPPLPG